MNRFIHFDDCSGSFGAWGYAFTLQTGVIVAIVEILQDLSSPRGPVIYWMEQSVVPAASKHCWDKRLTSGYCCFSLL